MQRRLARERDCVCVECGQTFAGVRAGRCHPCSRHRYFFMRAEARAAHLAVARARRAGLLDAPRGKPCADCGGAAIEYDHRDYSEPLEVEPVCRRCNLLRGPAKRAIPYAPRLAA